MGFSMYVCPQGVLRKDALNISKEWFGLVLKGFPYRTKLFHTGASEGLEFLYRLSIAVAIEPMHGDYRVHSQDAESFH